MGAFKDYPRVRDYVEDDLDQTDHGALRPETARCPEQRPRRPVEQDQTVFALKVVLFAVEALRLAGHSDTALDEDKTS